MLWFFRGDADKAPLTYPEQEYFAHLPHFFDKLTRAAFFECVLSAFCRLFAWVERDWLRDSLLAINSLSDNSVVCFLDKLIKIEKYQ